MSYIHIAQSLDRRTRRETGPPLVQAPSTWCGLSAVASCGAPAGVIHHDLMADSPSRLPM